MSERRIPYLNEELNDGVSADVGAPDISILRAIRDLFLREEPLVEDASFDNPLDPKTLHIEFADGLGEASWSRMDITWYRSGAYRFHYVDESDINWRFDRHPNTHLLRSISTNRLMLPRRQPRGRVSASKSHPSSLEQC